MFVISIDKRLEFIQALVLAVKQVNTPEQNEELDWVEYPDIPYVRELINKINIKKYPELIKFINDITDCGCYTNLFLFFDENFNLNNCDRMLSPFNNKEILKFGKLVKMIYDGEKIEEVFRKYNSYLESFLQEFENNNKVYFSEKLKSIYEIYDINFSCNISLLINGGFSAERENNVVYVRGVKNTSFNEYFIICLFHEYSHFFVNKIINKYLYKLNNIDGLFKESINNGLPKCYQNENTLLYEYFVRANSLILAENMVSKLEYDECIEWYKEIGFIRIEEIIDIIKIGIQNNLKFEEIYRNLCTDYINSINFKKSKQ